MFGNLTVATITKAVEIFLAGATLGASAVKTVMALKD